MQAVEGGEEALARNAENGVGALSEQRKNTHEISNANLVASDRLAG